jgi:hypothetical protein
MLKTESIPSFIMVQVAEAGSDGKNVLGVAVGFPLISFWRIEPRPEVPESLVRGFNDTVLSFNIDRVAKV